MPATLATVALLALSVGVVCAVVIVADLLAGHPQHMWIMNLVWPITALYAGPFALWGYFTAGRLSTRQSMRKAKARGEQQPGTKQPFWEQTALAATHCGSGCTLADVVTESILGAVPLMIFGHALFGSWVVDYFAALLFGLVFQYFTIVPMRHLSPGKGLWAALKADFLSLTAWQIGMYGWMAIAVFALFHHELAKTDPVFWFMMQIAMLVGFCTSYPVNWLLLRWGIKEAM